MPPLPYASATRCGTHSPDADQTPIGVKERATRPHPVAACDDGVGDECRPDQRETNDEARIVESRCNPVIEHGEVAPVRHTHPTDDRGPMTDDQTSSADTCGTVWTSAYGWDNKWLLVTGTWTSYDGQNHGYTEGYELG
jgi:hypothetical protein